MSNLKEINLLKQLISLSDLQESFEDCDEFDVSVSRFYLLENGGGLYQVWRPPR